MLFSQCLKWLKSVPTASSSPNENTVDNKYSELFDDHIVNKYKGNCINIVIDDVHDKNDSKYNWLLQKMWQTTWSKWQIMNITLLYINSKWNI